MKLFVILTVAYPYPRSVERFTYQGMLSAGHRETEASVFDRALAALAAELPAEVRSIRPAVVFYRAVPDEFPAVGAVDGAL